MNPPNLAKPTLPALFRAAVLWATLLILGCGAAHAATNGRQALATSVLRVCADPDNLPFSNKALEGFENRIIARLAEEMGLRVRYTWFPQSTGFVRRTLRIRECDLISGITTTSELVQNTNPYYHSVYTMVYRSDRGDDIANMSDPILDELRLGVVAGTPPANVLAKRGLLTNLKPYHLVADTRRDKPARQAVLDVDSGEIDVAFIWGPIAAYYARQADHALTLVPLTEENERLRLDFRVSMAVRYNENEWKRTVNRALKAIEADITTILESYGVPLLNDRGEVISVE